MRRKVGDSLWGIILIVIGIGYVGDVLGFWQFHLFFKGWWTLFIIVPCLVSMFENGVNSGNLFGAVIGILLLLSKQLNSLILGKMIFPIILIGIGITIISRGIWTKNIHKNLSKDNFYDFTAVFGAQTYNFSNDKFNGANITAVFGGIELNLKEAIIDSDIRINSTTIFGGAEIIVPENVRVKINCTPIFGGVGNKAPSNADENAPTIYFNCICIFGGLDIK